MLENTYGIAKRFDFVAGVIAALRPANVLDIGCGTGSNLTQPLAQRFAGVEFVGVDSDRASIAFAQRENAGPNLRFLVDGEAADLGTFDLIIASEVIEHVEDPDAFLGFLRSRLTPTGRIVLTLPNGLGPFECTSFVETLLHLSGIHGVLRALKHRLRGAPPAAPAADTLAVSPHINFLGYRQLRRLLASNGFAILDYRARTLFCGFGFDQCMRSPRLLAWNARGADHLPPHLVSGWMFVLAAEDSPRAPAYRRGRYARLRRYLNEKRWHLR